MERILEPEFMDTEEEATSYAAMDNSAANLAIVEFFLEHCTDPGPRSVLDIGTGPADIPILLAQRAPSLQITAVDAAATMLATAIERVRNARLEDRIALRRADAKGLPFDDNSFDAVLSNTILHHIPEPVSFLAEAARVLRPGGLAVIRDLYRPDTEAVAWQLVDEHAGKAPPEHRQLLFDSLHAALTLDEARAALRDAGLAGASVEMTSDRHYTIVVEGR